MNKGKVIIGIIVVMLIIAVVVGALASFTDIFKKDKSPVDKDKLEYKALANGDEVSTLYFNRDRELTFDDLVVMSVSCGGENITASEYVCVTHKFVSESVDFYIFFDMDEYTYGEFQLWLYVGKVSIEKTRILLYSDCEDKDNDVKKGWQFEKIELSDYVVDGEKITANFEKKSLVLQNYTGQFISANGAFIKEV